MREMSKLCQHIGHCLQSLRTALSAAAVLMAFPLALEGETMDSLYTIYLNAAGHEKTLTANKIFMELRQRDFIDTLMQFDKSDRGVIVEVHTHYQMADYFFNKGQFEQSMLACKRARDMTEPTTDDHLRSEIMGLLANSHFRLGNYDKALEALITAYQIDKKLGDDKLISSDLNTFAAIYLAMQQPQPGISYIEQAIAIERKQNRPDRLAIRLGMASELYLMDGQTEKALETIKEAYEIDYRDGREERAAVRLSQLGAVLEAQNKLEEAQKTVSKALAILEKHQSIYSTAVCHNQLGSIAFKQGNTEAAIAHHKKALEQSIKCGATSVERKAEHGLWQAMREENPVVAMIHLERYTALSDSLHQHIASAQMNVMNATLMNMEQDEISKEANHRRWLTLLLGSFLSIVSLVALGMMFIAWRRSKRALQLQQQTQKMRAHFIDNITHELHLPLTIIIDAGQQLQQGVKTSSEENRRMGDIISTHGNKMLSLINQLLDIDAANSLKPEMTAGDIAMFVRMLVDNFKDSANRKNIMLEFVSPVHSLNVMFAPERIRKIVQSLIENAIKFTPEKGSITVKLDSPERGRVLLQVINTGIGIPPQEKEKLFEPFYNNNGVDTVVSLALVRQLVLSIGGSIDVESTPGVGTTFTIGIPCTPTSGYGISDEDGSSTAEGDRPSNDATRHRPLVLIAESNDDFAFFIAHHLRKDYELRFVNDGVEAMNYARDLVPDLIIANMTLPVMNGKELIRQLREDKDLAHIPVIAMTPNPSEEERVACIQTGADIVLVKPFNSTEMRLQVKHLISQHALLKQRYAKICIQAPVSPSDNKDNQFIHRLMDVAEAQMSRGNVDIDQIAAALSISRKVMRERVMAITGLTPVAFVLRVRLNKAENLIKKSDLPLTAIANKCGFQNLSHFSKAFKQQFGVSPLQYRKHHGTIWKDDTHE